MAKGFNSFITIYENDGWYDSGTSNPIVPILEAEGLNQNRITVERNSMVRNTRAQIEDSLITGDGSGTTEYKPEGFIEVVPRIETITSVLMSHFQVVDEVSTGSSFINTYVPAKTSPEFNGLDIYGTGAYGAPVLDAFSIDIKKRVTLTTGSVNIQHYKRGLCDKLTFKSFTNEDFKVRADYKFKDVSVDNLTSVFGDADLGSYSSGAISDWSHGTWSFVSGSGTTITDQISDISSIEIECSNNITENKTLGNNIRQTFNFGNYTVKGRFKTEYLYDGFFVDEADNFSITGTFFHSDTEFLTISLPRCFVKPFSQALGKPDSFTEADVEFEAYEFNGTSPITVTTHVTASSPDVDVTFWDAEFGARTLSEFDFGDAGFGARTLSEFDFADRDI